MYTTLIVHLFYTVGASFIRNLSRKPPEWTIEERFLTSKLDIFFRSEQMVNINPPYTEMIAVWLVLFFFISADQTAYAVWLKTQTATASRQDKNRVNRTTKMRCDAVRFVGLCMFKNKYFQLKLVIKFKYKITKIFSCNEFI